MKMPSRLEFGGAGVRVKADFLGKLVKVGRKKIWVGWGMGLVTRQRDYQSPQ